MSEPNGLHVPKRAAPRSAEIAVGGLAMLIGAAMLALAAMGIYRALATPERAGPGVWSCSPDDPSIEVAKRVVAVGGDRVEIRDKQLFVNGQRVDEPWAVHLDASTGGLQRARRDNLAPTVVPPGTFFALGDNRDFSYDSRFYGPIPMQHLEGKVLFVYWSADRGRIGRYL